ncbi:MAG: outer membrane protein transport protein [Pseudomonadales bacterium]|nr:outer membrane protein transport protein [Pseudomonadales bacterium]
MSHNLSIGNPVALGMGNSATAYPQGTDSIHYNPAGLGLIQRDFEQWKLQSAFFSHEGSVSGSAPGESFNPVEGFEQEPILEGEQNRSVEVESTSLFLPFFGQTAMPFLAAPGFGWAKRPPGKNYVIANSAFAVQVFGYKREADNIGAFNGQQFGITRIAYFNPSIGYELTDDLYVGLSIGFSWQGLGMTTRTRSVINTLGDVANLLDGLSDVLGPDALDDLGAIDPFTDIGTLTIEVEDPISPTFTLGVLWHPTPWLSLGATYQSEGKADLKGDFHIKYTDEYQSLMTTLQPFDGVLSIVGGGEISADFEQSGSVEAEFTQPQWAAVGMSMLVTPSLRVNADLKWVDYSAMEELHFRFDKNLDYLVLASIVNRLFSSNVGADYADPRDLKLPRQYEAVLDWSVGIEYQYNDQIRLRAGYEPRSSAIPENRQDLLIPMSEADLYTIGVGYSFSRNKRLDIAFGYLVSEFSLNPGESRNSNSSIEGDVVYNPYRDLRVDHKLEVYLFNLTLSTNF